IAGVVHRAAGSGDGAGEAAIGGAAVHDEYAGTAVIQVLDGSPADAVAVASVTAGQVVGVTVAGDGIAMARTRDGGDAPPGAYAGGGAAFQIEGNGGAVAGVVQRAARGGDGTGDAAISAAVHVEHAGAGIAEVLEGTPGDGAVVALVGTSKVIGVAAAGEGVV